MIARWLLAAVSALGCVVWVGPTQVAPGVLLAQELPGEEGWRPMFPDQTLQGWVRTNTPPETWRFEDGMLICSGKPIGEIRTDRMYQNFILELQWRHMVPGGNAGIFVWADDITSRGVPFHRGIEVQVLENAYGNTQSYTTHGDIFPIHGATMKPINGRGGSRAFPIENRSNPSPEWNHYRIECNDGAVTLAVNGKVVTRGLECVPRKGYLCLESEGGVVHYRNVRLRELPATDIDPNQVAIADRGYQSIYTGLNLDGWNASEEGSWKANDWVLSYDGAPGQRGELQSKQSVPAIGFVVDVRLKDAESAAVIEAGAGLSIDLRSKPFASHLESDGGWNRVEAWSEAGKPVVEINGTRVGIDSSGSALDPSERSRLVLRPMGKVDFCNVYLRSVSDRAP